MAMEFTTANFEQEVLNSEVPVLVDFWAIDLQYYFQTNPQTAGNGMVSQLVAPTVTRRNSWKATTCRKI